LRLGISCNCSAACEAASSTLNTPANLHSILSLVAGLRSTDESSLARLTWANSLRLFEPCLPQGLRIPD
jgi:Tat protein secretion system quality control protein TatD with DNase activity